MGTTPPPIQNRDFCTRRLAVMISIVKTTLFGMSLSHKNVFGTIIIYSLTKCRTYTARVVIRICCRDVLFRVPTVGGGDR